MLTVDIYYLFCEIWTTTIEKQCAKSNWITNFESFFVTTYKYFLKVTPYSRVLKRFGPGSTLNNNFQTSGVHGLLIFALLALTGGPRRSTGNFLAVRILERGPHLEYPCLAVTSYFQIKVLPYNYNVTVHDY